MKIRTHSRRRQERDGASLVEFALVVPVFFVIFFGMVDVGRGFMVKSLLDNAARAGCRTGILQSKSNSDITAAVTAALTNSSISGTTVAITVNGASTDVSAAKTLTPTQTSTTLPTHFT